MQQIQTTTAHPTAMTEPGTHPWIYPGLTLGMSLIVFWGFAYTYFLPNLAGTYPEVSPLVHIHGWSFFLWFLLLPVLLIVHGLGLAIAGTAAGDAVSQIMALFARVFGGLY